MNNINTSQDNKNANNFSVMAFIKSALHDLNNNLGPISLIGLALSIVVVPIYLFEKTAFMQAFLSGSFFEPKIISIITLASLITVYVTFALTLGLYKSLYENS
ncbi:hypothetical protein HRU45_01325 [Candidatus Dependentiae bacterium]|nr:hypothetical protein [Candidatus Dependentiae bacterium]